MTIQNIETSINLLGSYCDIIQTGRCNYGTRQALESLRISLHTNLKSQLGTISNPKLIQKIEAALMRSDGLIGSFYPPPSTAAARKKSCWQATKDKFSDAADAAKRVFHRIHPKTALPLIGGLLSAAYAGYHYLEPIQSGIRTGLNFATSEHISSLARNAFQLLSSAAAKVNGEVISLAGTYLPLTAGQTLMGLGALMIICSLGSAIYAKAKDAPPPNVTQESVFEQV